MPSSRASCRCVKPGRASSSLSRRYLVASVTRFSCRWLLGASQPVSGLRSSLQERWLRFRPRVPPAVSTGYFSGLFRDRCTRLGAFAPVDSPSSLSDLGLPYCGKVNIGALSLMTDASVQQAPRRTVFAQDTLPPCQVIETPSMVRMVNVCTSLSSLMSYRQVTHSLLGRTAGPITLYTFGVAPSTGGQDCSEVWRIHTCASHPAGHRSPKRTHYFCPNLKPESISAA